MANPLLESATRSPRLTGDACNGILPPPSPPPAVLPCVICVSGSLPPPVWCRMLTHSPRGLVLLSESGAEVGARMWPRGRASWWRGVVSWSGRVLRCSGWPPRLVVCSGSAGWFGPLWASVWSCSWWPGGWGRVVVFELVLASSGASYYLQRAAGKSAAVRQLAVWLFGRCLEGLCQSGSRY
jgi:hypothetical protein